jgi:hypothetical protein
VRFMRSYFPVPSRFELAAAADLGEPEDHDRDPRTALIDAEEAQR